MTREFSEIITSEEQLREIMGYPGGLAAEKEISFIDKHCRNLIERSPFMLIASSDAAGNMDVSPKGDPPGFVRVLDETTLAIPDRKGNRRADTITNIIQNPQVGLLFLIPGYRETLRVEGTAQIVRDLWLREEMAEQGKIPELAIVVTVQEAFMHCAKCIIRSNFWDTSKWPYVDDLPTLAEISKDHLKLDNNVRQMQQEIDLAYRDELY